MDWNNYLNITEGAYIDPDDEMDCELHDYERCRLYWGSCSDDCCPGDMDSQDLRARGFY